MKPKIFVGSSTESLAVARAIHSELDRDAECTVWTQGVFGLSVSTLHSLVEQTRTSDYAIFVVTPDDEANVRGKAISIPRDNVIYELGLFSGAIGPERCFFLAPRGGSIHLPNDLLGITPGDYDPKRSDKNLQSAVAPFCDKVRTKIAELGSLPRTVPGELLDLGARFECCDWITNMDERVKTKQGIFKQMISLCSGRAINKNTLSQRPGVGIAIILAAAITANAENEDYQRLLNLRPATITRGVAQHVMVDTIIELDRQHKITSAERSALVSWAETFPDQDPSLPPKIGGIKIR